MEPPTTTAAVHIAYVAQQHLDGYKAIVKHAIAQKHTFNKHIHTSSGEVTFTEGQLVQVYHSNLDYTFKTERKLIPKWSQPYRVKERATNAYTLKQLNSVPIQGEFSV
jgi:hypothetical protein